MIGIYGLLTLMCSIFATRGSPVSSDGKPSTEWRSNKNGNFQKDIKTPQRQEKQDNTKTAMMDILMETAKPLDVYNRELLSKGGPTIATGFREEKHPLFMLSSDKDSHRRHLEDAYIYDIDDAIMHDFSSYSFKYGKCQPIQRFSQEAAGNGEYSALVTDYMVIFRLCPSRTCSSSRKWGCNSGYGEYVIKLDDYLKAMIYFQLGNRDNLCSFCQSCDFTDDYFQGNRRLEDNEDDETDENDENDDGYSNYNDDASDGDDAGMNNDQKSYSDECLQNSHLCKDHTSWCFYGNDDGTYTDSLDYLDYLEYFDCTNIDGQNGQNSGYWVSPRCDANGNIEMGIFYDPYCSQYAGNEVNLKDTTGVKFVKDIFAFTYHGFCLDCDADGGAPFYGTSHNLCNRVYSDAGKCNQYLTYNIDDDYSGNTEEVSCAYIENIKHGVYDENGEVYVGSSSQSGNMKTEITSDQTIFLGLMIVSCVLLSLYSCFLHHEITNLLLHKLSYQGSLAPKMRTRRSNGHGMDQVDDSRIDDYYSYGSDSFSYT